MSVGDVVPVVDEGLGNSTYLVDLGDGRALAVDASRDLRALREVADRRGLRVAFAADTHLHADFLTGATRLAADDGATVLASAAGNREYPHRGLGDADEVDLGGLTLRALATPGHTHEHLAFALSADEFRSAFARIRERGIPYGDAFNRVGTNEGPGRETGARGPAPTVYLFDPSHHLVEIRTYEG